MRSGKSALPFGPEHAAREVSQPLIDAMDELARLMWAIQDLETRLAAVKADMADRKGASKHAKRAMLLVCAARLDLTRLTQRKVTTQGLGEFRARHIEGLRRAVRSARKLAAQEHAATGQRVIEVRVVHTLREIVARWDEADRALDPGLMWT